MRNLQDGPELDTCEIGRLQSVGTAVRSANYALYPVRKRPSRGAALPKTTEPTDLRHTFMPINERWTRIIRTLIGTYSSNDKWHHIQHTIHWFTSLVNHTRAYIYKISAAVQSVPSQRSPSEPSLVCPDDCLLFLQWAHTTLYIYVYYTLRGLKHDLYTWLLIYIIWLIYIWNIRLTYIYILILFSYTIYIYTSGTWIWVSNNSNSNVLFLVITK